MHFEICCGMMYWNDMLRHYYAVTLCRCWKHISQHVSPIICYESWSSWLSLSLSHSLSLSLTHTIHTIVSLTPTQPLLSFPLYTQTLSQHIHKHVHKYRQLLVQVQMPFLRQIRKNHNETKYLYCCHTNHATRECNFISQGCPRPSITVLVQNRGLKHHFISFHLVISSDKWEVSQDSCHT